MPKTMKAETDLSSEVQKKQLIQENQLLKELNNLREESYWRYQLLSQFNQVNENLENLNQIVKEALEYSEEEPEKLKDSEPVEEEDEGTQITPE